jgi:hypothetical protein
MCFEVRIFCPMFVVGIIAVFFFVLCLVAKTATKPSFITQLQPAVDYEHCTLICECGVGLCTDVHYHV